MGGDSDLPGHIARKRNHRCFDKNKIRYSVRKEVAERMQRKRVSLRPRKLCAHTCGTSSNNTPMMRGGPQGPRSLCNAYLPRTVTAAMNKSVSQDEAKVDGDGGGGEMGCTSQAR
ncbi:hypothetical protein MKW92_000329 [Papaver armeniacum]|nr:hypothetical protein MKW92_000329 [Papaver armeniacum]